MEPTLSEIVEKMKCTNCTGYLRPPINYCTDGTNVCGLCKDKVTNMVGINVCLESIGSILNFPCKYVTSDCPSKVPWKDLEAHELGCPYRQYTCPYPHCPAWNGTASMLQTHILTDHSTQKTDITLSINENRKDLYFFEVAEDIYFVRINCDSDAGLIWLSMKSIKPLDQIRKKYFKVTISADGAEYVDFKPIECALNWELDEDAALRVDMCVLKIKLKMKCGNVLKVGFQILTRLSVYNGTANESVLLDLECPVCHDYMGAPIYQCIVGHSICSYCKPKLQFCPTCRSQFCNSLRNYTLESVSSKLHYKCMYEEQGCTFTSLPGQIQQHELTCDFGHCDCPVKDFISCLWRGRLHQMSSHALEEHGFKF